MTLEKPISMMRVLLGGTYWLVAGTTFTLTFNATSLSFGVTYNLAIKPRTIYDISGNEVYMPSSFQYQALNCGSHGKLINSQCQCSNGFTGIDCSSCDFMYIPSPSGCTNDYCKTDFCGCKTQADSSCLPLGTCFVDSETQTPKCNCTSNYTGANCEGCNTNYHGQYPDCAIDLACPECVINHGECNVATGNCDCFEQFDGKRCEGCASGYDGENCDKVAGGGGAVAVIAVVVSIVVIGIAAFLLVKRYRLKKKLDPQSYVPLNLETIDDDKDEGEDDEADKKIESSDLFQPSAGDKFQPTASSILDSTADLSSLSTKKEKKNADTDKESLL